MPNPLRDELTDEAKAELAAVFADLKRRFTPPARTKMAAIPAWIRQQPYSRATRGGW
jgi:hypothetical protein